MPNFDSIVPITKVDEAYFEEHGAKSIVTSSTGLDFGTYAISDRVVENAVFHLGSMDWSPNQEAIVWFLQNVWNKVIEKVPDAVFLCCR